MQSNVIILEIFLNNSRESLSHFENMREIRYLINIFLVVGWIIIAALFQHVHCINGESEVNEFLSDTAPTVECHIWLAPSTISGAGVGMYAGRSFMKDEELLPTGDSMVPIIDYVKHAEAANVSKYDLLWSEYVWGADGMLGNSEGYHAVELASPGFGSAANSFIPIYNVHEWYTQKDISGLHRSRDPGAGAFSPYHDRKSTARFNISAGEELYVSYSAAWFTGRPHFGPIPIGDNFDDAQVLVDRLKYIKKYIGKDAAAQLWDTFINNTVYRESRTIGTFHPTNEKELDILTQQQNGMTVEQLRKNESTRSLEWLEQYGTCGDHITVKKSTIDQAGRGAFAYRTLPKGTKVAQLPMIHITNRNVLTMYNLGQVDINGTISYVPSNELGIRGSQLLLNYCYGHTNSTLLLCPYGPLTNFINHNQSRANVKLVWGREESGNHMPRFLELPIQHLLSDKRAKLAMEIVAIRDIQEGEELFLDYGNEWEEAWNKHVLEWEPVENAEQYESSTDINDRNDTLPSIFDQLEGTATEFPSNVGYKCDVSYAKNGWNEIMLDHFQLFHIPDYQYCIILSSKVLKGLTRSLEVYTVHVHPGHDNYILEDEHHIIRLPRVAMRFYDTPYTHDIHLPNAFRHDIRIPDELFPKYWMNLVYVVKKTDNME